MDLQEVERRTLRTSYANAWQLAELRLCLLRLPAVLQC